MLKPPDAGDYVPNVKFKTAGRNSQNERPPWAGLPGYETSPMPIPPTSHGLGLKALAPFLWPVLWRSLEPLEALERENGPWYREKRGRPRCGATAARSLTIMLQAF